MTKAIALHDKKEIEEFLARNIHLQVYSIGDLDDFFFPYTQWYGIKNHEQVEALCFIYFGMSLPTLLSFSLECHFQTKLLLKSISHLLPAKIYAHLSDGLAEVLSDKYSMIQKNASYKMSLLDSSKINSIDTSECVALTPNDCNEIIDFLNISYPDNWFDERMLETRQYMGIRKNGKLISVAGVHVYSTEYKVAALANISTHPDFRHKGYSKKTISALCKQLFQNIDVVSLNVNQQNTEAIGLYKKLGFEIMGAYHEYEMNLL